MRGGHRDRPRRRESSLLDNRRLSNGFNVLPCRRPLTLDRRYAHEPRKGESSCAREKGLGRGRGGGGGGGGQEEKREEMKMAGSG
jgi:hypothetical protein